MNLDSYTSTGTKQATPYKVSKDFIKEVKNHDLIKFVYHANLNNHRDNLAITKTRGLIRGGGRKPWRQKGTGRARFGSSRNPIWRGGGIVFGPTGNENYSTQVNKKTSSLAKLLALNLQMKDKKLVVIDKFDLKEAKTKNLNLILKKLKLEGRVILVDSNLSENLIKAASNIPNVSLSNDNTLSVNKLLDNDYIVITKSALDQIIKKYTEAK